MRFYITLVWPIGLWGSNRIELNPVIFLSDESFAFIQTEEVMEQAEYSRSTEENIGTREREIYFLKNISGHIMLPLNNSYALHE